MPLSLGDEAPPYVQVFDSPSVRAAQEDVVRHDVVVAKGWYHRNGQVVGRSIMVSSLAEDLCKLGDHELILLDDLLLCTWYVFVVVVPCRIARPYDKVNVILDVVVYPLECLIDERKRRVAAGRLCAVYASRATLAMACCLCSRAGICLVERIWMKVCEVELVDVLRVGVQSTLLAYLLCAGTCPSAAVQQSRAWRYLSFAGQDCGYSLHLQQR